MYGIGIREEAEGRFKIWLVNPTGETKLGTILSNLSDIDAYTAVKRLTLLYLDEGVSTLPGQSTELWSKKLFQYHS